MKKLTILTVLATALFLSVVSSVSAGLSGSVYTAGVSKYLWRGQLLSDAPAIQPGFTLNLNKFSFGYWGSYHGFDSTPNYNESDYTFSFMDTVPYLDVLSVKAGFTVYTFPYSAPSANNSTEIFGGLVLGTLLTPTVTFYYDPTLGMGGYVEGGISHSYTFDALKELSVSGALSAGYNFGQWAYTPSFTALAATVGVSYTIAGFVLTPSVIMQLALDSQYKSFAIGSLSLAYNFSL